MIYNPLLTTPSNPKPLNVFEVLQKAYPPDAYAILAEVSDSAGHNRSRSADYIIVSLWPSRGLTITGIELKSSRQDWLNELKNPAKADAFFHYCNYFFLLTTDEKICPPEELPPAWGHLNIKNNKLKTLKRAPINTPNPLPISFICALIKRAASKEGYTLTHSLKEIFNLHRQAGRDESKRTIERLQVEFNSLNKAIKDFEKDSGFKISESWAYGAKETTKAAKLLKDNSPAQLLNQLAAIEPIAQKILHNIYQTTEAIISLQQSMHTPEHT